MTMFTNFVRGITCLLTVICLMIVQIGEGEPKENYYPHENIIQYGAIDALLRGQGVTTDNENLYFSSNYCLIKTDMSGQIIAKSNLLAIPFELQKMGCDHIGGISYANGKIYAPIEDGGTFEHLYIAVYDAATLALLTCQAVPLDYHPRGIPWVVADAENGKVYSAPPDSIEAINVYDLETLAFIRTIPIAYPIDNNQGGEYRNGVLYVSVSNEDQAVYGIELSSGRVTKVISRNLLDGAEGEGMTIVDIDGETYFYILNIASIRAGVQLRTYKFIDAAA